MAALRFTIPLSCLVALSVTAACVTPHPDGPAYPYDPQPAPHGAHALGPHGADDLLAVPPPPPALPTDAQELELFDRVNADRAAHGLPALSWDEDLAEVARAHARDMADHAFLEHVSPRTGSLQERLRSAGYYAQVARENLARDASLARAEAGLMRSPGHRANLLSADVTHVGLGVVRVARRGGLFYVTQLFSAPWRTADPEEVRRLVRLRIARLRAERGVAPAFEDEQLQRAADRALAGLGTTVGPQTLRRLSARILGEADPGGGRGIGAVSVLATDLRSPEELEVTPAILAAQGIAVATRATRDADGRPVVRLLVVGAIGRGR